MENVLKEFTALMADYRGKTTNNYMLNAVF